MTELEINIAIHESLGYKRVEPMKFKDWLTVDTAFEKGSHYYGGPPPRYTEDLNLMREVETTLPDLGLYRKFLYLVVLEDPTNTMNEPAFATAKQRAIAYLRTKGLIYD